MSGAAAGGGGSEERRALLGEPIELPWWVVPLCLPPAMAAVLSLLVGSSWVGRVSALLSSLLLIAGVVAVARKVGSRSMQSVCISTMYALWVFPMLIWLVAA